MSIQVTGTLTDPTGAPLKTTIRITAMDNNVAVKGSYAYIPVDNTGVYNFSLEEGLFLVQLLQSKEYTEGTVILVDNTVVSPISLGSLLDNHEGLQ